MKSDKSKLKLGVVGCGAIGSRIACSVARELKGAYTLAALHDIDGARAARLAARLKARGAAVKTQEELIRRCDIVVEAVNTPATVQIVEKSLKAGKSVLVMSIGRLLGHSSLFSLARRSRGRMILPSGAVAGLDAVKAASILGIRSLTLTSRKPPAGFVDNSYIKGKGISLKGLSRDIVLFDGKVSDAVRHFPQNINVAAAVALAAGASARLKVRIIASPRVTRNTHEVVAEGAFGCITTRTENTVCPDNPKTSYLAVISAIRALQGFSSNINIGT